MLFTFPSRYLSAIGQEVVFRLTRWSWQIHTGFHGPGATREQRHSAHRFRLRGSHPLRRRTHHDFDYQCTYTSMSRQTHQTRPTTPNLQPLPGITQTRFSHLRFRSPLLTESQLFSLPAGTEMFHFPAFPPRNLYIQSRVTPHNMVRGFPIRKSWPQRPVIDSTRLIADSHVLHRLLLPRHPPCAL